MAIKQIINKVANKVVDVASDIMSAPARMVASNSIANSNRIVADAKTVSQNKGKPDEGNYTDPLFRARTNNIQDKFESEQKAKKLQIAKDVATNPSDYASDYAKMRSGGNIPMRNDMQANGTYPNPQTGQTGLLVKKIDMVKKSKK